MARRGGRQDAILADQKLLDTICWGELCDYLNDLWVVVTTITTNDEKGACARVVDCQLRVSKAHF